MNRVCMVVLSLYPQDVRVRREAEALARAGIEVDVICLRDDNKQLKVEKVGSVTAYRILRERAKEKLRDYLFFTIQFCVAAFLKLQSLSIKKKYDVIQVHNMPDFLIFAGLTHKILGRPLVLDLHDLSPELFPSKWSKRKAAVFTPIVKWGEKLCCAMSDALITTSPGFHDRLVERGQPPEKITLVMNTADPELFKFRQEMDFELISSGARLLYHGTVAERFGVSVLVEAMPRLLQLVPGTTLNVYGRYYPSFQPYLENRIQELNLTGSVFLNGMKTLEEISEIICQSDIGVVPYQNDDFMNLALSTKTFEYAATGLPIVASRLYSLTSIFDDQCILYCTPSNSVELAENIAALCKDPRRRAAQVENARHAVEGISYSVMIERYLNLMKGLMVPKQKR